MTAPSLAVRAQDWLAGAAGAAVLTGLTLVLFRNAGPDAPLALSNTAASGSTLLSANWVGTAKEPSVAEEARLTDPTPLFLPTPFSAAHQRFAAIGVRQAFEPERPQFAFRAEDLDLKLPPPLKMPADPADALQQRPPGNLLLGIGESDPVVPPLAARRLFVEIYRENSGQVVLRRALTTADDIGIRDSNWSPVQFTGAADAIGLIGSVLPLPRRAAGDAESTLDPEAVSRLEKVLDEQVFLRHPLPPGFYRIVVAP